MPKPASRPDTAPIIATRSLKVAGSRRKAVITLRMPVEVGTDQWHCAYHVTGMETAGVGPGVDAMQALHNALAGIRLELNRAKGRYTWLGGAPGDHGFLQMVLHGFGPAFDDHIEQLIEREVVDHVRNLRRERRRNSNKQQ